MEHIDDLMRDGLKIIQDTDTFCFGIDAVLLSDFAKIKPGEKVLDLCSGNGIVSLLTYARQKEAFYTALEIQPQLWDMAKRSVAMNGLTDRIQVLKGDVREARSLFPHASFDVITVNPPYMKGQGKQNEKEALRLARHEVLLTLPQLLEACGFLLPFHGRLYMIHRAQRLGEILAAMDSFHFTPKKIRFVHPFKDKEASQVLIEASLRGGEGLKVLPPLYTYETLGTYTDEVLSIYNLLPPAR